MATDTDDSRLTSIMDENLEGSEIGSPADDSTPSKEFQQKLEELKYILDYKSKQPANSSYGVQRPTEFAECTELVSSLLHYKGEVQKSEAQILIEGVDKVIGTTDHGSNVYKHLLLGLRKHCGHHGIVPSSYVLGRESGEMDANTRPRASGSFGQVWRTEYKGQVVAVKRFRGESTDASNKKIFAKEAAVWKQVSSHRNIVPFLGISTDSTELDLSVDCILSQWMPNETMDKYLEKNKDNANAPDILPDRILLLVDICKGLRFLHSLGIVHGDLKGNNVLIDATHRARLTDFGFTSVTSGPDNSNKSTIAESRGTVRYMAPELFVDSSNPDVPADVFAFAAMSYEAFSGHPPFPRMGDHIVSSKVLSGIRPSRPSGMDDLTDELWDLVTKCWSQDAQDRPPVIKVLVDLEAISCKRLSASNLDPRTFESNSQLSLAIFRSATEAPDYGAVLGLSETALLEFAETAISGRHTTQDLRSNCLEILNKYYKEKGMLPPSFNDNRIPPLSTSLEKREAWRSTLVNLYGWTNASQIFSEAYRIRCWRKLWLNLAKTLEVANYPFKNIKEAISQMEQNLDPDEYQFARATRETFQTIRLAQRHEVEAHYHTFVAVAPLAKGLVHVAATSRYLTDNTDLMLFRKGLNVLISKISQVLGEFKQFALRHCYLPTVNLSGPEPELTTFGKRATHWMQDLLKDVENLKRVRGDLHFRGLKGDIGNQGEILHFFSGSHKKVKALDKALAKLAGFSDTYPITSQTYSRKIEVDLLNALVSFGDTSHNIATELRLLAFFKEAELRSVKSIDGLARHLVALHQSTTHTLSTQWLERTGDDIDNRSIVLPSAFIICEILADSLNRVAKKTRVRPQVARRRVIEQMPYIAMEHIISTLTRADKGVSAGYARFKIRDVIRESKEEEEETGSPTHLNFLRRVTDPDEFYFDEIRSKLPKLLDPETYIARAPLEVQEFINNVPEVTGGRSDPEKFQLWRQESDKTALEELEKALKPRRSKRATQAESSSS